MGRFLPKSLLGQTMLAIGVALLITQIFTAVLMYGAAESRKENLLLNRVALSLLTNPSVRDERWRPPPNRNGEFSERGPRRPLRTITSPVAPLLENERNLDRRAQTLAEILTGQGVKPHRLQLVVRRAGDDPAMQKWAKRSMNERPIAGRAGQPPMRVALNPGWANERIAVAGIQFEDGGEWRIARVRIPPDQSNIGWGIAIQTALLFLVLMGVLYVILRRITRPLSRLTERVGDFALNPDRAVMIEESGPADTRRLIAAHNRMEARIAALLDEKDVMLGAIGHDLKTPLAALRVRIESVPDDTQRERMAASIEDITRTLDDILSLARVGRNGGPAEPVNLAVLALSVVEEFEDLDQPVTVTDPPRVVAVVQETWLKRALRNLVSNAVRYGGSAHISVTTENGAAVMRVDDNGPGIPAGQIAAMMEPFTRGEASRNRATGGAGLGLTLARAIAEQHRGTLALTNRPEGGLRAEIRVPLS
jgi:signal transduction histidine kinase